jgi:predicted SAM-dependent methyltransferase
MCTTNCIMFGVQNLSSKEVADKRVLEVGSRNINGNLRPIIQIWGPSEYVGIDIEKGPGVDIVCNAEDALAKFGKNSFDVIICTSVIEHVKDWKLIISNFKNICKPNGVIIITTCTPGFCYHEFPNDFWRYEQDDMKNIFSDFEIVNMEEDTSLKGVFLKVKKPLEFKEKNLNDYLLYNIVVNKKIRDISEANPNNLYFKKLLVKTKIKWVLLNLLN